MSIKGLLQQKIDNSTKIMCKTCAHYCMLDTGQSGKCGIRANIEGKIHLLTDNLLSCVSLDPIEKKPLYHFYPGSKTLSISQLGCNFKCSFCQNWDISQAPSLWAAEKSRAYANEKISQIGYQMTPEEVVKLCKHHKQKIISYTYNEPTISLEYYLEIMKLAHKSKIKNVWVSNGYQSKECFSKIKKYVDAVNIDLKAFNEDFYRKHCKAELKVVKDNIARFYKEGVWVELTTLIIPDENDSEAEIKRAAHFIMGISENIPWHFSRFYPDYRMLDKMPTNDDMLKRCVEIARESGIRYVYSSGSGINTYCSKCGNLLINRNITKISLSNITIYERCAVCKKCRTELHGHF